MDDSAARTLWCGNLAWEVGDEVLYDLFLQAGPLEKVCIPKERDGRSKGYAFITFKHDCSVPYAMELMKGTALYGKMINLQHRTGAKIDASDVRSSHHHRSMSYQEPGMYGGSVPNMDQTQSLNNLYNMAADFLGRYSLMPPVSQDWTQQSGNQNHHRSRSFNTHGRYHDGNYRDERRGHHGNRNDRHQSRDHDYRNERYQSRDHDYRNDRHQSGGHDYRNDRHQSGGHDYRNDRHQSRDYDGFRGNNYQDRGRHRDCDQDQSRSNKRPTHKRFH